MRAIAVFIAVFLPALGYPQQPRPLQGDVYLAMESGEVRQIAATTIRLLAITAETPADVARACTAAHVAHVAMIETVARFKALSVSAEDGTASRSSRREARRELETVRPQVIPAVLSASLAATSALDVALQGLTVAQTSTGMQGRYSLAPPTIDRPAVLLLAANTRIASREYVWLVPVEPADSVQQHDLDNQNLSASGTLARSDAARKLCRELGFGDFRMPGA
jgi:hypothetical protein